MDINELIDDFLESLEVERGRSKKTIENYRLYLYRFYALTSELLQKDSVFPSEITPDLFRQFRLKLNRLEIDTAGDNLKAITQAYHLIALRGFLKYLARRGIDSLDPSLVDLPRAVKKQVTFLHYDEVEDLLAAIPDDTESGLRDRAIVELLFSGGLRVSELISLNRDSINLDRREFIVRGKGQKDRPIFISKAAADRVREYLAARTDSLPALFLNNSRNRNAVNTSGDFRRLTPRSVQRLIENTPAPPESPNTSPPIPSAILSPPTFS